MNQAVSMSELGRAGDFCYLRLGGASLGLFPTPTLLFLRFGPGGGVGEVFFQELPCFVASFNLLTQTFPVSDKIGGRNNPATSAFFEREIR